MNQKFTSFTEKQTFRFLFSILCVIFSALLQTYALKAFLKPAGLLSSGFTGLAILINVIGSQHNIQIPVSLMIVLLNLPVAILCGRSISTKFTILSSLQFVCVSLFLVILPFNTLFDDVMLNIIIGGVVYDLGLWLHLSGMQVQVVRILSHYMYLIKQAKVFGIMYLFITVSYYVSLDLSQVGSVQDIQLSCSLFLQR